MIGELPAGLARIPILVAHRGYPLRKPENTVASVEAALQSGACYVEVDVQLSADGIPVVMHDSRLKRTASRQGKVHQMLWNELKEIPLKGTDGRKDGSAGSHIPSLSEMAGLLRRWPRRKAFVEVKGASLEYFGRQRVMDLVLEQLDESAHQFIVISFDVEALRYAAGRGGHETGWIVRKWTEKSRRIADQLAPQFLFCKYTKVPPPPGGLWPGPWRWVLYEIVDPGLALSWAYRGADFIETMAIGELLNHPLLARGRCLDP